MRLLHTKTLEFKEFLSAEKPPYAILSHRWGENEVSYKEMRKGTAPAGPGLKKIQKCCELAASQGYEWCWIDTCCIDKRSSAELSEAINAMYKWYEGSSECYVHLSDVEIPPKEVLLMEKPERDVPSWEPRLARCSSSVKAQFRQSSWFTRGWTLQELLAPETIHFYDANWNKLGELFQLRQEVSDSTGIDQGRLHWEWPMSTAFSVAQKMSLASRRKTTREEDVAYCLLGLFGVNMPLIYGEGGKRAFYRLQVEIMANSDDESLFAWDKDRDAAGVPLGDILGVLAPSPSCFIHCADVVSINLAKTRPPYNITNKGLKFAIPRNHHIMFDENRVPLILGCCKQADLLPGGTKWPLCILVEQATPSGGFFRFMDSDPFPVGQYPVFDSPFDFYTIHRLREDLKQPVEIYLRATS